MTHDTTNGRFTSLHTFGIWNNCTAFGVFGAICFLPLVALFASCTFPLFVCFFYVFPLLLLLIWLVLA